MSLFSRRSYSPFVRRQRRASRLALYGSLALAGLLLVLASLGFDTLRPDLGRQAWQDVDFASIREVQLFQGYLQIDTTIDRGSELKGARYLASALDRAGIPYTLEQMGESGANLWAVLEGRRPEALVLHSHIDTDPVKNPERWRYPPFSATIEGPWVYGRGAFDMKSVTIAQLESFLSVAESGRRPERSLILLATGSEEVGSDLGMKWLLRHRPELTDRFWAMLTEGGAVETRSEGDIKYWGIEAAQKRFVDVYVCSARREPLEWLREHLIEQRRQGNFQVRLSPEVERTLRDYAPTRDAPALGKALSEPRALRLDGIAWRRLADFPKGFFRDEALPWLVEEVPAGGFSLKIKFHLLPGSDFAAARARLLPPWTTAGMTVQVFHEGSADGGSPLDHPLFRAAADSLREAYPDAVVGPYFLPWTATDSRFARAAGIPSYGYSPFLFTSFDTSRIGREDERMELLGFLDGVETYRRLVTRLTLGADD